MEASEPGFFAMAIWLLVVNWIRQRQADAEKEAEQAGEAMS